MIIISVLVVVLAIGICFIIWGDWDSKFWGQFIVIIGSLGLFLCAVTIPLERLWWNSTFAEVEAVRQSRDSEHAIEGAAWRIKAAEVNAKLARGRFYNGTLFDIWIPDEIESIDPIK